jgi:hypothetical protein
MAVIKEKAALTRGLFIQVGQYFIPFPPASHPNADTPLLFCVRTDFLVVFLADDPACGMGVLDP